MIKFTVYGRLPGMNDLINAERRNRYLGAKLKKEAQMAVEAAIASQIRGAKADAVEIHYRWFEPNKRRDLDNISGYGHKVIQDALVSSGVLENDGWKNIVGFRDEFYEDKNNPRIEVILCEKQN